MNDSQLPQDAPLIAVVGMAGRFPGAWTLDHFWRNLREGVESITRFTDQELEAAGVDPALLRNPHYVKANAVVDRMEWFDAGFFGLSPRDAAIMDPQTRHFLECAWEAMEHAGHVPDGFGGAIGVFAGSGANQYLWKNLMTNPELVRDVGFFLLRHTGNDKDFLATRASYEFDLTGPSINIQTACSTSLVAIHYAAQSLLSWECDMALAGGVTIEQPHRTGYLYQEGEILSPDGHCRSFDAASKGTVFGSGAGVVVLRRLADALEDGDTIHAVIRGSAINNDGAGKVGYLAPSVDGQARAIAEALSIAGVEPEEISYVEAHGTATPVGDPIEVAALTQAFRTGTEQNGFCALGSVKSNIGHLDTAAGVAGFIKTVLALKHGEIPPSLHFDTPNPSIDFLNSPFFVNDRLREWHRGGGTRKAGISSLGVGGTNAHIILEEAPVPESSPRGGEWQLLPLSGKSTRVVDAAASQLVEFLEGNPQAEPADVAFTLQVGRKGFKERMAVVARSGEDAVEALATGDQSRIVRGTASEGDRPVAFLFAGGGAQYPGMGRGLYEAEPVYREAVDECLLLLEGEVDTDLGPLLFPEAGAEEAAARELERPSRALPALFTVQYAQARLWMSWGIRPASMIGHSMGEYTAACLAGVFSLKHALALVACRGRLFETVDAGGMLSVSLTEEALRPRLGPELSVAAINAPELCVASGPVTAIDALADRLEGEGVDCRRIRIDVAAHSSMLEPILGPFREYVRTIPLSPPELPFISNLSGGWITGEEATDADYWVRHLRETVRFSQGLQELLRGSDAALLEVGPGRTLATLARLNPARSADQPVLHSIRHPGEEGEDLPFLLSALGRLWVSGVPVEWGALHGKVRRRRIPLPTYPFQRQPHFVAPGRKEGPAGDGASEAVAAEGGRRNDVGDWFHQPVWRAGSLPPVSKAEGVGDPPVLVLAHPGGAGARLAARMAEGERRVVVAQVGESFMERDGGARFTLRPGSDEDLERMLQALQARGQIPGTILHTLTWAPPVPPAQGSSGNGAREEAEGWGFRSLLQLLQGWGRTMGDRPLRLVAVTSGSHAVAGDEPLVAEHALLAGPIRVAPRELPGVTARLVDVPVPPAGSWQERRVLDQVAAEAALATDEVVVAYRGPDRLVQEFRGVTLPPAPAGSGLREGGVYLITGGLGGLGLVFARHLAETVRARLVLVGRKGLPPRQEWPAILSGASEGDKTAWAIREVQGLEALGSPVLVAAADLTDASAVEGVVAATLERFGALHGVLHAAGILEDAPLLSKDRESVDRVLAAKVPGTRALERALQAVPLDFWILFSSTSSVAGLPGQVDYTAANAFLDAFARERGSRDGSRVISVGWGPWREVGMAAELMGRARYGVEGTAPALPEGEPVEHPLFDRRMDGEDGSVTFATSFRQGRHWMLDEHRIRGGDPVLPGAGYIELALAAHRLWKGEERAALRDLYFLAPFVVPEGSTRELEVRLSPSPSGVRMAIVGRRPGETEWTEHARGEVDAPAEAREAAGLDSLRAACGRASTVVGGSRENVNLDFGPRWGNLQRIDLGEEEALLTLELPGEFHGEVPQYSLHPALLDMATAGAQRLIPGFDPEGDFFVPASYGGLRVQGDLPSRAFSHVRYRNEGGNGVGGDLAVFDVTILDGSGAVVAEATEFVMARLHDRGGMSGGDGAQEEDWLAQGIVAREGIEVLNRILGNPVPPHLFATPRDLGAVLVDAARPPARSGPAAPRARPALPVVELAPVEEALASHPAVKEAAATAHLEGEGDIRVVAFVVYEGGTHATVSELRRYLRERLEGKLVPQNFVEMAALPRLPDSSVDRPALPDPFAPVDEYVEPRTSTQRIIAGIWMDLLGLERVSIHDNFLDVGGHSLVGIRTLLRIEKETGARLHPNALTLQTVEQLAAECDRITGKEPDAPPSEIEGDGATETPSAPSSEASAQDREDRGDEAGSSGEDGDGSRDGGGGLFSRVRQAITGR